MTATVRIQFDLEDHNEDALYDTMADLTYDMRSDGKVTNYVEEVVDFDE